MIAKNKEQKSWLSVASLILGIVWLVLCVTVIGAPVGIPVAILALIFGIIALVKKQKKGMAVAGVIISWLVVLASVATIIVSTIFIKNNSDVLIDPIMWFSEMMENDPELEELMENPEFRAEFEYLFEMKIIENFGEEENVENRWEAKTKIPMIFEEMESVLLELKEKYKK